VQGVKNTSYNTRTGEKVLRIETIVDVSKDDVWAAFTTEEAVTSWMTSVASIKLRVGGYLYTHYDKDAKIGDPGTIKMKILNYIEGEMITFKINLNEHFSDKARAEDGNLQEIVQFKDLGKGRTKVVSSMIGWGEGKEWDDIYDFFVKGNEWTYNQLVSYLSKGRVVGTHRA
jgi:uncharacterized protein YndB with AHSA1/START domain